MATLVPVIHIAILTYTPVMDDPNAHSLPFAAQKSALSDVAAALQLLKRKKHWQRLKRLTAWLLLLWTVVTFGCTYFARELNVVVLGWPFSYWMAAQGVLLMYLFIIGVYAWSVHKLDVMYGLQEEHSTVPASSAAAVSGHES
jgi:putative solute:sodium symporter small subunit